jgi:CHAT domain-containing protein/lipopolysaccharide biosynthesis regulator YciM
MSMALFLLFACSRAPGPPAGADRGDGSGSASPSPLAAADACLARGEEAREREDYGRAREEFEKARALFEKDRNWEGYVRALNLVGSVDNRQGDYKAALEHLNAALATAKEKLGPSHREVAQSYQEIGKVYVSTGQSAEALEFLAKALSLRRAGGGEPADEVAEILMRMAFARTNLGEDEQALALLDEAEALQRKAKGRVQPRLADILNGKGTALWGQGNYDQAIAALKQAIAMLEAEGSAHRASLASAHLNLANAYWSKSDYDEALTFYGKALSLQVAVLGEAHPAVGTTYMNLAILDLMKGDYVASIASAEKALGILVPALGERNAPVVQTYNALGSAYTRRGDPDRSLAVLEKARLLQLSLSEKGERNSASIYSSLGDAYRAKRDFARAIRHYRQGLAIDVSIFGERHPDVAEDYVNLGELYLDKGDEGEALRFFAKAIAANDPQPVKADPDLDPPSDTAFSEEFLLKALKGAARARARRGARRTDRRQLERAALAYEHAARLIDRMRAGYRAEGSKLSLAASATETYDEAIRTELDLHRLTGEERHLEGAFRYTEKSKAGVLRDALNEAEARSFSGIPAALLEQERQLRVDLAAVDRRLTEAQLETSVEKGRLPALREKQFDLKREYEALVDRFEREHPDYYDLKHRFETVSAKEVGAHALDENTVLLEYFLGHDRISIFVVTPQGLSVTNIPLEASLEDDVSRLRRAISARNVDGYAPSARRLYRLLLAPVEDRLTGKDLIIVPDGLLSTLPFDALLARDAGPENKNARELPYLLRDHAVSYAYSATLLLQGMRRKREPAADEYVAFAPVFAEGPSRLLARDAPEYLPASRQEVMDVLGLFRAKQGWLGRFFPGRSRVYLGREATEGRLKSAEIARYRYVHLATHGLVNEEHPGLSRLLLMPESGSGEDGVLHLGEVYNLRLNADLVVLSACDTGRGRIARGEGIIGLSRGFLYAGAKSLLVSLWPVSDDATSSLIVDFYRELLGGRSKTRALREAKLRTMDRNPEYAKPFYWSSLILVGEGR